MKLSDTVTLRIRGTRFGLQSPNLDYLDLTFIWRARPFYSFGFSIYSHLDFVECPNYLDLVNFDQNSSNVYNAYYTIIKGIF